MCFPFNRDTQVVDQIATGMSFLESPEDLSIKTGLRFNIARIPIFWSIREMKYLKS